MDIESITLVSEKLRKLGKKGVQFVCFFDSAS